MIEPASAVGPTVLVEIWSDVVCPWCYVGKRRFEKALELFDGRDSVDVRWRSFELDPRGPVEREGSYLERLARKYRVGLDEAQAMVDRMTAAAAEDGIEMRFDLLRAGGTFDAHRLLHLAADHGLQAELEERLFRATFTEGVPTGRREALVPLAVEVGLDEATVLRVLADGSYAEAVREDERRAEELGVTGVPFFVLAGRYGLSGAQHPRHLAKALATAWREAHAELAAGPAAGACDGGACAV